MIHYLTGIITDLQEQSLTLQCGPFGFAIFVPNPLVFEKNVTITLHTALVWNQETGPSLFGFKTTYEKEVFLLATSCPGVGPKLGLNMLAGIGAQAFISAISAGDTKALSTVHGVGAKRAEQIIVQLKHKIKDLLHDTSTTHGLQWHLVAQALESLNYSRSEISYALSQAQAQEFPHNTSFDQLLRTALSYVTKNTTHIRSSST